MVVRNKNYYVSSCPILDVFSQGKTEEQAKNNLIEALTLFMESIKSRSRIDKMIPFTKRKKDSVKVYILEFTDDKDIKLKELKHKKKT